MFLILSLSRSCSASASSSPPNIWSTRTLVSGESLVDDVRRAWSWSSGRIVFGNRNVLSRLIVSRIFCSMIQYRVPPFPSRRTWGASLKNTLMFPHESCFSTASSFFLLEKLVTVFHIGAFLSWTCTTFLILNITWAAMTIMTCGAIANGVRATFWGRIREKTGCDTYNVLQCQCEGQHSHFRQFTRGVPFELRALSSTVQRRSTVAFHQKLVQSECQHHSAIHSWRQQRSTNGDPNNCRGVVPHHAQCHSNAADSGNYGAINEADSLSSTTHLLCRPTVEVLKASNVR